MTDPQNDHSHMKHSQENQQGHGQTAHEQMTHEQGKQQDLKQMVHEQAAHEQHDQKSHEQMVHEQITHEQQDLQVHEKMVHKKQDHHAMMVEDFKRRFYISLIITVPILLLSPMIQMFMGVHWMFPGDSYLLFALSTILFIYGGKPFITGARVQRVSGRKEAC